MKFSLLAVFMPLLTFAEASRAPMDWAPVQTNAIARWKAENQAPEGVVVDATTRSVRLLAEATGVSEGESVEFLAIGPLSDRAYESLLVTVASPTAIVGALDRIGVPRGTPTNPLRARLWPYGEKVSVSLKSIDGGGAAGGLATLLKDMRAAEEEPILGSPVVWTGGLRDAVGELVAATNVPCAVFALYNHAPSLMQLDGLFDQTSTYGRFVAQKTCRLGELFEISVAWDGVSRVKDVELVLSTTNATEAIAALRKSAETKDMHVRLRFDESVTVDRAASYANAFALLDGKGVKMNGLAEGQFYFRAFLPDPKWRERASRIFQPFEIHVSEDGSRSFVFCEEDWSGEGDDPVLRPHTTPFKDWNELPGLISKTGEQGSKVSVLFIFAPKTQPVVELTPILTAVGDRIDTFYVFGE